MPVKKYRPTSPGRRGMTTSALQEVSRKGPEKSLVGSRQVSSGGRNNQGRLTVRRRGGGHKRAYRLIDFKRDKSDVPGRVAAIEYDPNRSARIALIHYLDGEKRYILAPLGLQVGDQIVSGERVEIRPGNALLLAHIPAGTFIHNIEMKRGKGGQLGRSAGCAVQLMAKEENYVQIRLMSGEVRRIDAQCMATVGQVGNVEHENVTLGKAGRSRWLGRRPRVRGVAMNPVDHPHGGGEGKAGQGNPHPVSPWGQPTKGFRTRRRKNIERHLIKRRK